MHVFGARLRLARELARNKNQQIRSLCIPAYIQRTVRHIEWSLGYKDFVGHKSQG